MSKLRFRISMSLDGFVAGPSQSVENPLGIGGMRLHEWAFALAIVRAQFNLDGGEVTASTAVVEESQANIGATVMGRNMFGGHPGHGTRARRGTAGGATTRRSTIPCSWSRTTHARRRAPGRNDVHVRHRRDRGGAGAGAAGGARSGRDARRRRPHRPQYLAAGLVDEMEINLVPTLLGGRRAALRRDRGRSARAGAGADRRHAGRHPPEVRAALTGRRRTAMTPGARAASTRPSS